MVLICVRIMGSSCREVGEIGTWGNRDMGNIER